LDLWFFSLSRFVKRIDGSFFSWIRFFLANDFLFSLHTRTLGDIAFLDAIFEALPFFDRVSPPTGALNSSSPFGAPIKRTPRPIFPFFPAANIKTQLEKTSSFWRIRRPSHPFPPALRTAYIFSFWPALFLPLFFCSSA